MADNTGLNLFQATQGRLLSTDHGWARASGRDSSVPVQKHGAGGPQLLISTWSPRLPYYEDQGPVSASTLEEISSLWPLGGPGHQWPLSFGLCSLLWFRLPFVHFHFSCSAFVCVHLLQTFCKYLFLVFRAGDSPEWVPHPST